MSSNTKEKVVPSDKEIRLLLKGKLVDFISRITNLNDLLKATKTFILLQDLSEEDVNTYKMLQELKALL